VRTGARKVGLALLAWAPVVRCERCGAPLFRAVPVLRGGRLRLHGAERAVVRVRFTSRSTLAFRHEAVDACSREIELPVSEL
jgi:hypothetical protein